MTRFQKLINNLFSVPSKKGSLHAHTHSENYLRMRNLSPAVRPPLMWCVLDIS